VPLLLHLALRALLRNRLSCALLVAAVAAGVGFQIPNTANIDGYTAELLRKGLSRSSGHLLVSSVNPAPIEDAPALTARLRGQPHVLAVSPRLIHAGVVFKRGAHLPVRVVGVDPADEQAATSFCSRLRQGRCLPASGDARSVVLGASLAEQLRLRAGERVKLVLPYENLGEVEYASAWYDVAGVLEPGGGFSADSDLFVPIALLRRVLGRGEIASALVLIVDDVHRAGTYARALQATSGARTRVQPWWEVNEFVANAIAGNRALSTISMVMVIVAVVIPVAALLYILVLHERKQIAVLGAIGFGRGALFAIYLLKAALIGVVGAALGVGLGFGLCALFNAHPIFAHDGFVVRPVLSLRGIAIPTAVIVAVTLLAGLAPALRAARSNPSTELREE
jgi:lipoprotein-releasing system permease protein